MALRISLSALAILTWMLVGAGIWKSFQYPGYTIQMVEVEGINDKSPMEISELREWAQIPVGSQNLFRVDLKMIESRILANRWIRSVRFEKRPPQTLGVTVQFREPKAVLQAQDGHLLYVDAEGQIFGPIRVAVNDLPILTGVREKPEFLKSAVGLIDSWNQIKSLHRVKISSLSWDAERGYRLTVIYPIRSEWGRSMVNLGVAPNFSTIDGQKQIQRLSSVFKYLGDNRISARQIFAEVGKKIIVKIARRS